jgi:hypothetical protein
MSKAMDALDRVAQYVAGWKHSIAIGEQLSLLRDYITTTEAERDGAFGLLRIHGIPEERSVTIANGIEVLATRYQKSALSDAARIKELEEAIDLSWKTVDEALGEWGTVDALYCPESVQPLKKLQAYLSFKAALSGARKVEPC